MKRDGSIVADDDEGVENRCEVFKVFLLIDDLPEFVYVYVKKA